jgi:hypothetical protein
MLRLSSMRFNTSLDTSHQWGRRNPFKDAGVGADSLTRIHNAMVKCLRKKQYCTTGLPNLWQVSLGDADMTLAPYVVTVTVKTRTREEMLTSRS